MLKRVLAILMLLVCAAPALAAGSIAPCERPVPRCCQQHRAPPNTLQAARCCQLERSDRAPTPLAVQQAGSERVVAIAVALPEAPSVELWAGAGARWLAAEAPPVRPKRFLFLRQLLI